MSKFMEVYEWSLFGSSNKTKDDNTPPDKERSKLYKTIRDQVLKICNSHTIDYYYTKYPCRNFIEHEDDMLVRSKSGDMVYVRDIKRRFLQCKYDATVLVDIYSLEDEGLMAEIEEKYYKEDTDYTKFEKPMSDAILKSVHALRDKINKVKVKGWNIRMELPAHNNFMENSIFIILEKYGSDKGWEFVKDDI